MPDRIKEIKGRAKEGVGKVIGSKALRAEGQTEAESARAARKVKGVASEVGGSLKEGVGRLMHDPAVETEGKADRAMGKARRAG